MSVRETTMKYRTEKWIGIIRECQASGLSKRMWCAQNNINEKTFYYWLRKLRQIACQNQDLINPQIKATSPDIIQPIVPVTVLKDEPAVKQENIIDENPGIILSINSVESKRQKIYDYKMYQASC